MQLARELLNLTEEQIWSIPDQKMVVQFDDGELTTTNMRIVTSWYAWEYHRRYPITPLLRRHCLQDQWISPSSTLNLTNTALWDVYDAYNGIGIVMDDMNKLAYDVSNAIYNVCTRGLERYVTSISALDFLDVIDHPKIREIMEHTRQHGNASDHSVENAYAVIKKVLLDPNELENNGVAKAAKSGLVSMGQILQCISFRGYATDIDSNIFKNPIMTGFFEGIRSLEDAMKESRSAAKALFFTKDPMKKSEYFNRNIQLSAASLYELHHGDCGSTYYISFTVKPGNINPGLLGVYYLNDKGEEEMITNGHKHLVGKTIQIRNVFGCQHPDPYGICSRCFGDLALSFPSNTNVGHFSSAVMQGEVGQRILSTKHEDASSTVESKPLDDYTKRYIGTLSNDKNLLKLNARLDGTKIKLLVNESGAKNLYDIAHVTDVKSLVVFRITEIDEIQLTIDFGKGKEEIAVIDVSNGPRSASFTHKALSFIKEHGWTVTETGEYEIDLTGWNINDPLFELPMKHHNMVDYMKTIEKVIKGTGDGKDNVKTLMDYENPETALSAFFDLVSSKMDVSISHLQVVMLTTMAMNPDKDDYRIPKPGFTGKFSAYKDYMGMRSLSPMMAYQRQAPTLLSVKSYTRKVRPKHPLDALLVY